MRIVTVFVFMLAVTVGCGKPVDDSHLGKITVTPNSPARIYESGTQQVQFTAVGTYYENPYETQYGPDVICVDEYGNPVSCYEVTGTKDITHSVAWSSSNTSVATIDASGLAKLVSPGTTTITASSDDVSGNTTLEVVSYIDSITLTPQNLGVIIGAAKQFTATGKRNGYTTQYSITNVVTWSSSNTAVATINSTGLATAVSAGITTISATLWGGILGNTTLSVTEMPVSNSSIRLPKTGQMTCSDSAGNVVPCGGTGQDGDLQKGIAWPNPRFTDNSNGTVTDNLTGLIWLKDANCFGNQAWSFALIDAYNLASGQCGLTDGSQAGDWRLPNINELESLVDSSRYDPALPAGHLFTNVQSGEYSDSYWSATTNTQSISNLTAWDVNMYDGFAYYGPKDDDGYLWPVRAGPSGSLSNSVILLPKTGQTICFDTSGDVITCPGTGQDGDLQKGVAWPNPRFIDMGDETIADSLTGLQWLEDANCIKTKYPSIDNDICSTRYCSELIGDGMVTWQHGLDFVKGINDGLYSNCGAGKTDWRLPNRKELRSLVDYSEYVPLFSNVQGSYYWTSTTVAGSAARAWPLNMYNGHEARSISSKTHRNYVWPVRAGQ